MESTNLLKVLEEKPEFKSHLKVLGVGEYTINSESVIGKFTKFGLMHRPLNSPRHQLCLCL